MVIAGDLFDDLTDHRLRNIVEPADLNVLLLVHDDFVGNRYLVINTQLLLPVTFSSLTRE